MRNRYLFLLLFLTLFSNLLLSSNLRQIRLQLKWKHQFQFAGYYAAIEKGFYKDAGFDVKVLELGDNETSFDAVFSGKAEFGTSTTDILLARAEGKKAVVLASIFQHSPHVLITLEKSGIRYAQELIGKRVAFEPGADELFAFLIAEGVALDRLSIEEYDFNMENLLNGNLDGISAYSTDEPFFLEKMGQEIFIMYPSSAGIDFYGDLLFTTEDMIKREPLTVAKFRAASLRGWAYAMQNKEEIIKLIYYKYSTRHSIEHLRYEAKLMDGLVLQNFVEIGYSNPGRWETILNQYKKLGRIKNSVNSEGLLYADYIRQNAEIPWKLILIFTVALLIAFIFLHSFHQNAKKLKKEIQKRKEIQEDLTASEALYRSILKASPDDITVTDIHGVIQIVSPVALQLLGCDSESEIIGKNVSEFTHPDDLERARNRTFFMLDGIQIEPEEYRLVRMDGSIIETELNAEIFRDVSGKPSGIVMIIRNIQERKQREMEIKQKNEELTKTNAEKDKFFSILAHDLRNPFHAFLGLTQLLIDKIDIMKQNDIQTFARTLNKSAKNLYSLLENLLEWSRIQRGLNIPRPSSFLVNSLVNDVVNMFLFSTQLKHQTLDISFSEEFMALADVKMIETVFRNLISNAVKFTPKDGNILVTANRISDDFINISIKDSGIGMNREMLDSLFKIDANVNRPGTEGETSSGLGLMLCKEFVEINGGTLNVESVEGKGSQFSFTLKSAKL